MFANKIATFFTVAFAALTLGVAAFDASSTGNMVAYWGQNSAGIANGGDRSKWEKPLADYCKDDTYDIITLSFMTSFPKVDLNFAYHCDDPKDCNQIPSDIKFCQSKGKKIILSMGGATGNYGLESEQQGAEFANAVWDRFLGGKSDDRPFGDAVLDGVDLDIESGANKGYAAFTNTLHDHFKEDSSKQYFITAAPQCPFPDASLNDALDNGWIDLVFIQFYNNYCGLNHPDQFNFDKWADWAANTAKNSDVKLFIGAPAAPQAAGQGYVDSDTLLKSFNDVKSHSPSHLAGVMLWEASLAGNNNEFGKVIAQGIRNGASTNDRDSQPDHVAHKAEEDTTTSSSSSAAPETTSSSEYVAPSSYVAPETTSSSEYVAPSSYVAPETTSSSESIVSSEPEHPTSTAPSLTDFMASSSYTPVEYSSSEVPSSTSEEPTPSSTYVAPSSTEASSSVAPTNDSMEQTTSESAGSDQNGLTQSNEAPSPSVQVSEVVVSHVDDVTVVKDGNNVYTEDNNHDQDNHDDEPYTTTLPNGHVRIVVPEYTHVTVTHETYATEIVYVTAN